MNITTHRRKTTSFYEAMPPKNSDPETASDRTYHLKNLGEYFIYVYSVMVMLPRQEQSGANGLLLWSPPKIWDTQLQAIKHTTSKNLGSAPYLCIHVGVMVIFPRMIWYKWSFIVESTKEPKLRIHKG